jgi:glucuronokinase
MLPSSHAAMRDSRSPTPNGVRGRAFARAALLGNPSDGFGGKTIGFTFAELAAEVTLVAGAEASTGEPEARHLIDATIARFSRDAGIELPPLAATVRTEIPREVGLGGSSALVTATLRALCTLAAIALAVETEDLGIAAGPQDRLIQAHEGLLYMDFSSSAAGDCERLDPAALPPLFVAWRGDAGAPSSDVHADLRRRYRQGDRATESTLDEIAALAERGRRCLAAGDAVALGALMEENVAARGRLVDLDPRHLRLVELASALGAPANYAGSGGAIVGLIPAQIAIEDLRGAFAAEGCELCPATPAGDGFSA